MFLFLSRFIHEQHRLGFQWPDNAVNRTPGGTVRLKSTLMTTTMPSWTPSRGDTLLYLLVLLFPLVILRWFRRDLWSAMMTERIAQNLINCECSFKYTHNYRIMKCSSNLVLARYWVCRLLLICACSAFRVAAAHDEYRQRRQEANQYKLRAEKQLVGLRLYYAETASCLLASVKY